MFATVLTTITTIWRPGLIRIPPKHTACGQKKSRVKAQHVIESYAPLLAHSKVKLFSDNQGAGTIVDKGSPGAIINQLAIDIFVLVLHNITLCPQWIPRSENERADFISKFLDKDDWKINPMIFDQLNRLWGPHTVDRFSSHYNNQIQRFNLRFTRV